MIHTAKRRREREIPQRLTLWGRHDISAIFPVAAFSGEEKGDQNIMSAFADIISFLFAFFDISEGEYSYA